MVQSPANSVTGPRLALCKKKRACRDEAAARCDGDPRLHPHG
jgi:hypothetical protein